VKVERPALSIYLMADADTPELAAAAVAGGATGLEIGIPYSDPLADGPTVQRAGQRSLRAGMTTRRALEVVAAVREAVAVPLVPMTYAAPVMAYGEAAFCAAVAAAGANGLIVPDVPADEAGELLEGCRASGLDLIPLLAPTSTDRRIALACSSAGGFVYLVSVAGTTGARAQLSDRVGGLVTRVRAHTALPLLIGFGIAAPEHAAQALAAGADGVVIGSRAIEIAEQGGAPALEEFVASVAAGIAAALVQLNASSVP
jgi:tryptophan synthase alpha chain